MPFWRRIITVSSLLTSLLSINFHLQTLNQLCSFYSQYRKSKLWCTDFHKYETYYCLNQGTIFVGEHSFLFFVVREVLQLGGGKVRRRNEQQQHVWPASLTASKSTPQLRMQVIQFVWMEIIKCFRLTLPERYGSRYRATRPYIFFFFLLLKQTNTRILQCPYITTWLA